MEKLWDILSGAPWWVYVLLVYLVSVGIKSTKPRKVSIQRVFIIPVLFVIWSCYGLYSKLMLGFWLLLPLWLVFLGLGTWLGIKEVCKWSIARDHSKKEVTIPGNYSTLVLILLIFVLKFFWGYIYATRVEIPSWIYFADIGSSSLVTGFFVGRASFFIRSYYKKR